jgi:hypothetical protein
MTSRGTIGFVAGLAFGALLFSNDGFTRADSVPTPVPEAPAGPVQSVLQSRGLPGPAFPPAEPSTLPPAIQTPAPGEPPVGSPPAVVPLEREAAAADSVVAAEALESTAQVAAAAATNAPNQAPAVPMPATPPPDLIPDAQPITGSVFDREDNLNYHPVDSDPAVTSSFFDREDRLDDHPVP